MGNYNFSYVFNDEHEVEDKIEDQAIELLQDYNKFAKALSKPELCSIYDVFTLEQALVIIYYMIVEYLMKEK